jgi:hypothetical protein
MSSFPGEGILRNIRKHIFGLGLGSLVMLTTIALLPSVKTGWLRVSGAVIPNASRTESYTDKPIRILSVEGQRWVTWDKREDAAAYHALVILPAVPISDSGGLSESDFYSDRLVKRWLVRGNEERELDITYDAMWQTITVDSRTYPLRKGNLFVIRFDENWKPQVRQLSTTINRRNNVEELERLKDAFKSALPEDKIVQQL